MNALIRGLYIATTGMLAQRRAMDVTTNNIANAQTVGFKKDYLSLASFEDVLVGRLNDPAGADSRGIGTLTWGSHADEITTDYTQGSLNQTGDAADLALSGDGFFVVQTPQGLRYTRSGNFTVSADGYLCTQQGYYVMGTAGRVQVGGSQFTVDSQGYVSGPTATANRLLLAQFPDNTALVKDGNNLYTGPATATAATGCQVLQGVEEASNVDLAQEMVDMISISRNYESNGKALTTINATLDIACNRLGKL